MSGINYQTVGGTGSLSEEDKWRNLKMLPEGGFALESDTDMALRDSTSALGGLWDGRDRRQTNTSGKLGMNTGTFSAIGDIFGGLGDMGRAYAAIKGLELGEKGLKQKAQGFNANYAAAMETTNNPIRLQKSILGSKFYDDPGRAKELRLVQPARIG